MAIDKINQSKNNDSLFYKSVKTYKKDINQKRLHITVDFEEMFDWSDLSKGNELINGLNDIEKFHQRCLDNKIQPTYLVTYKVLCSEAAVSLLKSMYSGKKEIGIHLHCWNTPPFEDKISDINSFQCHLPASLEMLKIERLFSLFEEKLGFKPLIHRAGRYGASQQTLDCLNTLGIKVDLSPSAGFNFEKFKGPNFSSLNNNPFWSDCDKQLLCVPVPSINFFKGPDFLTRNLFNLINYFSNNNQYKKFLYQYASSTPVRLSPESNDLDRMKIIGKELDQQGVNDIVISVHSTSLYCGGNMYSINNKQVAENIRNIIEYSNFSKEYFNTVSSSIIELISYYE